MISFKNVKKHLVLPDFVTLWVNKVSLRMLMNKNTNYGTQKIS